MTGLQNTKIYNAVTNTTDNQDVYLVISETVAYLSKWETVNEYSLTKDVLNTAKIAEGLSKHELMVDKLYNESDSHICQDESSEILAKLKHIQNRETVFYGKTGKPHFTIKAAEVAYLYKCEKTLAKVVNLHKKNQCCEEIAVSTQDMFRKYTVSRYLDATTHSLKSSCTLGFALNSTFLAIL